MEYTVIRSDRKTLSVSVKDGNVVVRAPRKISEAKIAEFVNKHRLWISRRVKEQSVLLPDFTDGTTVEVMGKVRTVQTGKTRLTEDVLFLPQNDRERALIALLRELTRERMVFYTEKIAKNCGFRYEKITITSARTRWGSCNAKGTIAYTFRTAFLPDGLAVYLAVHELCHTRHMDHSRAFWEEVGKILPDWKDQRRALRRYEWAMKCF